MGLIRRGERNLHRCHLPRPKGGNEEVPSIVTDSMRETFAKASSPGEKDGMGKKEFVDSRDGKGRKEKNKLARYSGGKEEKHL